MIVATAGHVDHGKTSLIRHLTGVDTDRLEEEKRRGLSINLGYAYLSGPQILPVGFIDVPGHQRFINNMIAGVSGIDAGLLLVAADDGIMPQTLEHLDVLELLGVPELLVVLSKIDRVQQERVDGLCAELQELTARPVWGRVRSFTISNHTGEGIEQLRAYLLRRAAEHRAVPAQGRFYLSIDRAFSVRGTGLVVTGTVAVGSVKTGDHLQLMPGGDAVRARGLRVHDAQANAAQAGQRVAINLAGEAEVGDIARGFCLRLSGEPEARDNLDAEVQILPGSPVALRHHAAVKVYLGAARIAARALLLNRNPNSSQLLPGDQGLVRLRLDTRQPCYHGQRFVLRDDGEGVLIGGGRVLDPYPTSAVERSSQRMTYLDSLRMDSPASALNALLSAGQLIDVQAFSDRWNLTEQALSQLPFDHGRRFSFESTDWLVGHAQWQAVCTEIDSLVSTWHAEHPQELGMPVARLRARLLVDRPKPLCMAAMTDLIRSRQLILSDGVIRQAAFKNQMPERKRRHLMALRRHIEDAGVDVPLLSELVKSLSLPSKDVEALLRDEVRAGRLHKVSERRHATPAQLLSLTDTLIGLQDDGQEISVITTKQAWGTGRNITVELLEYFDSVRVTQRRGNVRIVLDRELPAKLYSDRGSKTT
ncbi:MAG: selenocysteine-specific translation elongation factor [Pseudomonadota bacterium]